MSGQVAGRTHRTWPQRLLIVFNVFCIVAALVGAGSIAYAKRKVGQIDRVDLIGGSGFKGTTDVAPTEPRNFLVVGADDDAGLPADARERQGRDTGKEAVQGVRSDTIMVVRVDPRSTDAKILSIPRDLWVTIPGRASKEKINSALEFGGAQLLIQTIKESLGIEINNYMQVNFAGFKSIVDRLGGVPVWFDTSVRDRKSGLNVMVDGPACVTLDGQQALDYARSRYFQYQDRPGHWKSDGAVDYGRISRQQDFIRRVIRRARQQGLRNPVKLAGFIDVGVQNITLDSGTKVGDMVALGKVFRNFDPQNLRTYSLPTIEATHSGSDALDLDIRKASGVLDLFRPPGSGAAGEVDPSTVSVRVLNGTDTPNQASSTSGALASLGFQPDGFDGTTPTVRTEVRYAAGNEAQAATVARHLDADPLLVVDPAVTVVTVVTGPDFRQVLAAAKPASEISVPGTAPAPPAAPSATIAPTSSTTTTRPTGSKPGSSTTSTTSGTTTTAPVVTTPVRGYVPGSPPAGVSCG